MRLFETILLCLNIVLCIGFCRSKLRLSWLAGLAVFILCSTILIEGPRWQMYPAYTTTVILFTCYLRHKQLSDRLHNRIIRYSLGLLCALILLVSTALPVLIPVFRFPKPKGNYEIGTQTYYWIDSSRKELSDTTAGRPRELMVQIWYPAQNGSTASHAPYLPDAQNISFALASLQGKFPDFFFTHLKYVRTHARTSAAVATSQPDYPVLIFLEGLTGYRQMNSFQVEGMVSHGYIVVGIDQPGIAAAVTFPDGRQIRSPGRALGHDDIPYFAQDVTFVLEKLIRLNGQDTKELLYRKMDLGRIGIFGVSYGGIIAAKASLQEPKIKACLIMEAFMTDDVVHKGLHQPAMWITRDARSMRSERAHSGGWTEADINQHQTTMRDAYKHVQAPAYFVQLPGMFHIDLTDLNALSPILPYIRLSGPMGSQRAHDLINEFSLAFFDQHLKGIHKPLLHTPLHPYPDALLEHRQP